MPFRNDDSRWGQASITLHWLTFALVTCAAVLGLTMGDLPLGLAKLKVYALHKSLGLTVLALSMLFTLTGNVLSVFFLLPVALMVWFVFLRPAHRKRYRAAIAQLPRWDLRAE